MRLKKRNGAILVLTAAIMVLVLSVLAVVADVSRMYVQKSDLQTAADAAALAGVVEIIDGSPTTVKDSAAYVGQLNRVVGRDATIAAGDIHCAEWNDIARTSSDESSTCTASHNSVSVTTRATSTNSIAGFLSGVFQLKATARAWAAYVGESDCIKPWAIPYTILTKTLQPLNMDTLRNLDATDAAKLRSMSREERTFKVKIGSPPNFGNFGSLEIPPSDADPNAPNGGSNLYKYNITTCNPNLLGVGDTIDTEPGGMKGPTVTGVEELCELNGSFNNFTGDCFDSRGNLGLPVKVPLWSEGTSKDGGRYAIIVRQLVTLVLENITNGDAEITGYFIPARMNGKLTPNTSALQRPILVQ